MLIYINNPTVQINHQFHDYLDYKIIDNKVSVAAYVERHTIHLVAFEKGIFGWKRTEGHSWNYKEVSISESNFSTHRAFVYGIMQDEFTYDVFVDDVEAHYIEPTKTVTLWFHFNDNNEWRGTSVQFYHTTSDIIIKSFEL